MNAESQTKPWLPETCFLCSNGSLCLINYLTKNQKSVLKIYIGREGVREDSVEHRGVLGQWVDSLWSCDVAGEEGDDREWDGWMASSTRWTWVWASSGRWWRTAKPGVPQSMGLQRVRHDWATEQEKCCIHVMIRLSKPAVCMALGANPNVSYGLGW